MVEVAESYEIVGNFNNFKAFVMFVVKKLEALFILVDGFATPLQKCLLLLVVFTKRLIPHLR